MTQNWSISGLSDEIGMDRRTIKKILSETAPCDIDGKTEFYKLQDFVSALIAYHAGDEGATALEREKVRKTSLEADLLEIEKGLAEGRGLREDFLYRAPVHANF